MPEHSSISPKDMKLTFQDLAEVLPQIVWTADPDGRVDYISSQWEVFSGVPETSPGFLNWTALVHPDEVKETLEIWKDSLASGKIYERIFRLRSRIGEYKWFSSRALPMRNDEGEIIKWFGTVTDIDKPKRNEEFLRRHTEDRDRFIAMLGHELRNPLAAINTSYEILERDQTTPRQREKAFQILGNQLSHLTRLVDDTLDLSRLTSGKLRLVTCPLEVGQIARDCCQALAREAQDKGITLVVPSKDSQRLWINGDDVRLSQCLTNLLTNALKFTDPGGRVEITVEGQNADVLIKVSDNGMGMPSEDAAHLFTPFMQGEDAPRLSTEGLGLGLAVVKKLVVLHGGSISVHSPGPDQGTTFTLAIPMIAEPDRVEPESAQHDQNSSIEILVIEDNESVAQALQLLLELDGHTVTVASDGESALTCLESMTPDVILSDLTLPGHVKGWDLAEKVSGSYPDGVRPYLIALSGHTQPHHVERSLDAGFDEHLSKPPTSERLREALARGICFLSKNRAESR